MELILGLPGGAISDRLDRRLTMITCDTIRAGVLAVLAVLVLLDVVTWPVEGRYSAQRLAMYWVDVGRAYLYRADQWEPYRSWAALLLRTHREETTHEIGWTRAAPGPGHPSERPGNVAAAR